jgi:hypothetical protein
MPSTSLSPGNIGAHTVSLKAGTTISPANFAIFQSPATMETYLLANGYTQLQLNSMGYNDQTYAIRLKLNLF